MASLLHSDTRRKYSWWWDSHISPKNSKWLQENLTDMDAKVKAMIKLIEEDADSFARRAEMYYKKRPELMKLVEEFYRAYRALAERYDHATGELRQAHRTMAEAFPNQIPFGLSDDSPSDSSATEGEPHTPEIPHPVRTLFDADDLQKDALGLSSHFQSIKRNGGYPEDNDSVTSKRGLKQLNEMFGSGEGAEHAKFAEGRMRKGLNFHEEERKGSELKTHYGFRDIQKHEAQGKEEIDSKTKSLQYQVSQLSTENQNLKKKVMAESERAAKVETELQSLQKSVPILQDQMSQLSIGNQNLKTQVMSESEHADKAETEIQNLQQSVSKLQGENQNLKEVILDSERAVKDENEVQSLQGSVSKLQNQVSELSIERQNLKKQVISESARAIKAETEVKSLEESVCKLQDQISQLSIENQNLKKQVISDSECAVKAEAEIESLQQSLSKLLELSAENQNLKRQVLSESERASKAEIEAQSLRNFLSELEELPTENKNLKTRIISESERVSKVENEVQSLQQTLSVFQDEKESLLLQYQQCLNKISNLEAEITGAQEDVRRLNGEMLAGATRLIGSEERCLLLERANHSLQSELDILVQRTIMQQQEISNKQDELEKLRVCIKDECLHLKQAEAALQSLQNLHSQSQEEQRILALELQHRVQMLNDMEFGKKGLEDELRWIKEENQSLNEQNMSSIMSIKNLQDEIFGLKEAKLKLEEEVCLRIDQRNALQQELYCLKEEKNDLGKRHQSVIDQLESLSINVESVKSFIMGLQDENLKLKEMCEKHEDERVVLLEKQEAMENLLEKNALLENSLSDVNIELEGLRETLKALEGLFQPLQQENCTLTAEKDTLICQLESITDNMENLTEKNAFLENSLSDVNVELDDLRRKSKSLQESYCSLQNKISSVLDEKKTLVSQLKCVRQTLDNMQKKYTELEEESSCLQKANESSFLQVHEIQVLLDLKKQQHVRLIKSSNGQLAHLENQISLLQEQAQLSKKEFEEEQDNLVNAQVEIFVMQLFIHDMQERNLSLSIECQKRAEASVGAGKLISELEVEKHWQRVEIEALLERMEKMRTGFHQVSEALGINLDHGSSSRIEDRVFLEQLLRRIEHMQNSISDGEDEKQELLLEKLVNTTLLEQLIMDVSNLKSERTALAQESETVTKELLLLQTEKHELKQMNGQLWQDLQDRDHGEEVLKEEIKILHGQLSDSQKAHETLHNENYELLEENRSLMKEFCDLKEETYMLEEETSAIVREAMTLECLSVIYESFGTEKTVELKSLSDDMGQLCATNHLLEKEVGAMVQKVEMESLSLGESVKKLEEHQSHAANLEEELKTVREGNEELHHQFEIAKNLLDQKEMELGQTDQKLQSAQHENEELRRDFEGLKLKFDYVKMIGEELQKRIVKLSEDNKEITCLRETSKKLESELYKFHEEIEGLIIREEYLDSELQRAINEVELSERDAAELYHDLQIAGVCAAVFEEKACELVAVCESLEGSVITQKKMFDDESLSRIRDFEMAKEKINELELQNEGLKAELVEYLPLILSLRDRISSLQNHGLSLTRIHATDCLERQDSASTSQQHDIPGQELVEDDDVNLPAGILELQNLQTKVLAIEEAVMAVRRVAMQGNFNANAKRETGSTEIEQLNSESSLARPEVQTSKGIIVELEKKSEEAGKDPELQKNESEVSKVKHGLVMKDIELDYVSDSLSHEYGVGSYGRARRENAEPDDQMLQLWETVVRDGSTEPTLDKMQKPTSATTVDTREYRQIEALKQKNEYPSSELQAEKELAVDKLEIPKKITKSPLEGSKRNIERLATNACRLTNLQVTLEELKKTMDKSGKSSPPVGFNYDNMKAQLKEVEETILQLVDINSKLTKNAEHTSTSFDSKDDKSEDACNVRKCQITEKVHRWSEKIGQLELEVQRIQFVLLKLEDEHEIKRPRAVERRARVLLRDYLYGGRERRGRKKVPCCACIRPLTKSD